jgi:hypothetical protein
MKNLETYEGLFSNIFGKKDKQQKDKDKDQKRNILSIDNFFNKKDDDLAKKILLSLEKAILSEDNSKIIGKISRYADYKRTVKFQGKDDKVHIIEIQKSTHPRRFTTKSFLGVTSGENYILVVDGKHFIDRKTNKSTVSQRVCKKIWELLDKEHNKDWFDKENLSKSFE